MTQETVTLVHAGESFFLGPGKGGGGELYYLHDLENNITLQCTYNHVSQQMSFHAGFCQLTITQVDHAPAWFDTSSVLGSRQQGVVYSRESVDIHKVCGVGTGLLGLSISDPDVEIGPLDEEKIRIGSDANLVRSCSRHTCYSSPVSVVLEWHVIVDGFRSLIPSVCKLLGGERR